MPWRTGKFATKEAYNAWYHEYRLKNADKIKEYKKKWRLNRIIPKRKKISLSKQHALFQKLYGKIPTEKELAQFLANYDPYMGKD